MTSIVRPIVESSDRAAAITAALRQRVDAAFLPRRIIHVASLPRDATGIGMHSPPASSSVVAVPPHGELTLGGCVREALSGGPGHGEALPDREHVLRSTDFDPLQHLNNAAYLPAV